MIEFCTCGAQLPPDARFCHKCGKPQYELIEPEVPEPSGTSALPADAPPVAQTSEAPPTVNWKNPVAIRTAFLAGAVTSLVMFLPLPALFQMLWQMLMLLCGGFFAVYLYNRRTGKSLTARAGAYLGWISGIFCFMIVLVLFTLSMVAIATGGGWQKSLREMIAARGNPGVAEQFDALLTSPIGVGALLFAILLTWFVMVTVLPTIGGALGAKVLEKE